MFLVPDMTIDLLRSILGWATVINVSVVTLWFVIFMRYHDALYRLHSKRFKLSRERFDSIHYAGMAFDKIGT